MGSDVATLVGQSLSAALLLEDQKDGVVIRRQGWRSRGYQKEWRAGARVRNWGLGNRLEPDPPVMWDREACGLGIRCAWFLFIYYYFGCVSDSHVLLPLQDWAPFLPLRWNFNSFMVGVVGGVPPKKNLSAHHKANRRRSQVATKTNQILWNRILISPFTTF